MNHKHVPNRLIQTVHWSSLEFWCRQTFHWKDELEDHRHWNTASTERERKGFLQYICKYTGVISLILALILALRLQCKVPILTIICATIVISPSPSDVLRALDNLELQCLLLYSVDYLYCFCFHASIMLYVLCVGNFSVIFDSEAILRDVDALENVMTSKVRTASFRNRSKLWEIRRLIVPKKAWNRNTHRKTTTRPAQAFTKNINFPCIIYIGSRHGFQRRFSGVLIRNTRIFPIAKRNI